MENEIKSEEISNEESLKAEKDPITVPVKFNHETRELNLEDAAMLAQKGLKYDMISSDYERLKNLAGSEAISVSELLNRFEKGREEKRLEQIEEKCGGDKDFARHILELEQKSSKSDPIKEINEYFPSIKDISQLPQCVIDKSLERGSNLLDEYLRYRAAENLKKKENTTNFNAARNSSIGSQKNSGFNSDIESDEFIRGIWGE